MMLCHHCHLSTDDTYTLCPQCGEPLEAAPPISTSTADHTAAPPVSDTSSFSSQPARGKAIAGVILSACGLGQAATGLLALSLLFTFQLVFSAAFILDPIGAEETAFSQGFLSTYIWVLSLIIAAYAVPMTVVGRYLSCQSRKAGNTTKQIQTSLLLSRIGIILLIIMGLTTVLSMFTGIMTILFA